MKRKIAAHRIWLPDGTCLHHEVIVLDDEGKVLSHHPLQAEEPFVEWHVGDYVIK